MRQEAPRTRAGVVLTFVRDTPANGACSSYPYPPRSGPTRRSRGRDAEIAELGGTPPPLYCEAKLPVVAGRPYAGSKTMNADAFKTLPQEGDQFETLIRALLESMGFEVVRAPGRGTDAGCDILVKRTWLDAIGLQRTESVVVQCKHYANSGRSVGPDDVGSWHNAMLAHAGDGYLLVTDTRVTSNLQALFTSFTTNPQNHPKWAKAWDVDELIEKLNAHPTVRDSWFPKLPPQSMRTPESVIQLKDDLMTAAREADQCFDNQQWDEFASVVNESRRRLGAFANHPKHFELYFHLRRLAKFTELRQMLSGQQLAFERVIEASAVERLVEWKANIQSTADVEAALAGRSDVFTDKAFDLIRQESERLSGYISRARRAVMVGCGALPHTLISAAYSNQRLDCTGLDYDNSSLVMAHRVRQRLGLGEQIHFVTQNGDVFDYRHHDMVIIANLVSPKAPVLRRAVETVRDGAILIVRNPVTFGEVLWDDARYSELDGIDILDRFDSNAFGQCFETVVLRRL